MPIVLAANPYEEVYRQLQIPVTDAITVVQTEQIVMQMGFMHNALGAIIKDIVSILALKIDSPNEERMDVEKVQSNPLLVAPARTQEPPIYSSNPFRLQEQTHDQIHDANNSVKTTADMVGKKIRTIAQKGGKASKYSKIAYKQPPKTRLPEEFPIENTRMEIAQRRENHSEPPQISNRQTQLGQNQGVNLNEAYVAQIYSKVFKPQKVFEECKKEVSRSEDVCQRAMIGKTKKEREQYMGIACPVCERFYAGTGLRGNELCNCSSRHRSNLPFKRETVPSFSQQLNLD